MIDRKCPACGEKMYKSDSSCVCEAAGCDFQNYRFHAAALDRMTMKPKPAPAPPALKPCPNPECGGKASHRGTFAACDDTVGCCVYGPAGDPDGSKWNALPRREDADALRKECAELQRLFRVNRELAATHQCKVCKAKWILLVEPMLPGGEAWTLASATCGKCCDNVAMGEQIEPIGVYAKLYAELAAAKEREITADMRVYRVVGWRVPKLEELVTDGERVGRCTRDEPYPMTILELVQPGELPKPAEPERWPWPEGAADLNRFEVGDLYRENPRIRNLFAFYGETRVLMGVARQDAFDAPSGTYRRVSIDGKDWAVREE